MNKNQNNAKSGTAQLAPTSSGNCNFGEPDPDPFPPLSIYISTDAPPETAFGLKSTLKANEEFPYINPHTSTFRSRYFPDTCDGEWNSWKWQLKNRIHTLDGLERIFTLSDNERNSQVQAQGKLPLSITPYYASLIDPLDLTQPIRKTVIPVLGEFIISPGEAEDPLNEEGHCVAPGLFHRYPDRVLFLTTNVCSVNCRYCTRSRVVGDKESAITRKNWDEALAYISIHREVRDVLISGGDPLILPDESLEYLLKKLRDIPHVEIIRIGTKVPMVLPQRITKKLVDMLKQYHPLWMSIHVTHPDEITLESTEACRRLADAGIPLGSQTVLLKGVNNSSETLKTLFQKLMRIRVKPYYLYQCDPIVGSLHFRTTVKEGIEIIRNIRGFTSGYAVPHYVIDAPGGGGKIPISPDYIQGTANGKLILTNYEGKTYEYPDKSLFSGTE